MKWQISKPEILVFDFVIVCMLPGFLFPRSGHRVVVEDNNLYVLGGYNPKFHNVPNTEDTYYPLFKEVNQPPPLT